MKTFFLYCLTIVMSVLGVAGEALSTRMLQDADRTVAPLHNTFDRPVLAEYVESDNAEPTDAKDDPGYAMYKEGYNLVLDEQWEEARKKFAAMIKQYPQSEYIDDAQYWSAFALKHIDTKKAAEAYRKYIKDYPKSNYYDDALADVAQIESDVMVVTPEGTATIVGSTPKAKGKGRGPGYAYSYSYAPQMERSLRDAERSLRTLNGRRLTATSPTVHWGPGSPIAHLTLPSLLDKEEKLDPETQLKIEALYALGNTKEDDKSFTTLKEVALDFKAARPLRQAALDALSGFKKYDVLPVYIEIAKRDTMEEMQNLAIDVISSLSKDKNKSVITLIDLFNTLPKHRNDQRRTVFYFIADVGNDRAVDFLATVARTNEDYDLRREAVFYLGNIGSEKARTALYGILSGKR